MGVERKERDNGLKMASRTKKDIYPTRRPVIKKGKRTSTIREGYRKEVFSNDSQFSEKEGKDCVQPRG